MTIDEYQEKWWAAFKAAGHVAVMQDGSADIFVMDSGYHNGPGCSICGEDWCWHCSGPDEIKPCIGAEATAEREARRARDYEDRVLAEADAIRARRANATQP